MQNYHDGKWKNKCLIKQLKGRLISDIGGVANEVTTLNSNLNQKRINVEL